jgi:hypothetical protein
MVAQGRQRKSNRAFSSEVDTGSREENASKQKISALPSSAFTSTADDAVFASDVGKVPTGDVR